MNSETIRGIPLQTQQSRETIKTAEGLALDYKVTQLVFLREIAAQLAEIKEVLRKGENYATPRS